MSGPDYETLLKSPLDDDPGRPGRAVPLAVVVLVAVFVGLWFIVGSPSPEDDAGAVTTTQVASATTSTSAPTTIAPTTTQPPTTTSGLPVDVVGQISALLDELEPVGGFSGVVLVAHGDEVLLARSVGLANVDPEIPIRDDFRFNLGSMDKMFTAVAILQLMEEGLLSLDGPLAEYLADYPNADVASKITIEQLLTHTSGIAVDVFNEEFSLDPHGYRENSDYLPLFVDEPLAFAPGEEFAYSNAGFIVLGLVVEELTGMSYDAYVREHIFEPSEMMATGAYDVEDESTKLAIGYTTTDINGNDTGVMTDHRYLMPGRGTAAGGGYSTAGDLHRFSNALFEFELLSPDSVELLATGRVEIGEQAEYAFGFFDRVQAGERVVGHGGGAPGVCSSLSIYPETGYTVVVLSNSDHGCMPVLELLAGNPPR